MVWRFLKRTNTGSGDRLDTGRIGEQWCVEFLKKKGYKIVERNFRCRYGEIDVVARDGDTLVFIEVKTRRSRGFGLPKDSLDARKKRRIITASMNFLRKAAVVDPSLQECPVRFDVVGIELGQGGYAVEHIQNAFEVEE